MRPQKRARNNIEVLGDGDAYYSHSIPVAETFLDLSRELKSICTDFVVNDVFTGDEDLGNFLSVVNTEFTEMVRGVTKKANIGDENALFLFKGGNVLRLVEKGIEHDLSGAVSDMIHEQYAPFFKRSDADFSIYVNPTIGPHDDYIRNHLFQMAFDLQVKLRNTLFITNRERFFGFFRLNKHNQRMRLAKMLERVRNATCFSDQTNSKYYARVPLSLCFWDVSVGKDETEDSFISPAVQTDNAFVFSEDEKFVKVYEFLDKSTANIPVSSPIFVTSNAALKFKNSAGGITQFYLARSKMAFRLKMKNTITNTIEYAVLGGELIDVSLPLDKNVLEHFFSDLPVNMATYSIRDEDSILFKFKTYSIHELASDLSTVIFDMFGFPWDDAKYKKRLVRLCLLNFVLVLEQPGSNNPSIIIERYSSFIDLLKEGVYARTGCASLDALLDRVDTLETKINGEEEPKRTQDMIQLQEMIETLQTQSRVAIRVMCAIVDTRAPIRSIINPETLLSHATIRDVY